VTVFDGSVETLGFNTCADDTAGPWTGRKALPAVAADVAGRARRRHKWQRDHMCLRLGHDEGGRRQVREVQFTSSD